MLEAALIAQVIFWLVVLGVFLASGQASLLHPSTVYLVFHGLVFVVRPLLVHFLDFNSIWTYIGFQPDESAMIKTLAVTSVALAVFVGVNLFAGRVLNVFPPGQPDSLSPLQSKALVITGCLLLPLMAFSIIRTASGHAGGERAANGIYIMTTSTGYINDAQFMVAPLLCAWLLMTRFHWLNALPVTIYVGYRTWCGLSRFTIITFLLAIVMSYCWYHRKKWPPLTAILAAIPVLMLFNTLGHNREYLQNYFKGYGASALQLDAGLSRFEKFRARTDTQDFANYDYLTFILALVPERTHTYTYGVQYLQLFTEPIPRILWRGKPAGAPVETFDISAYGNFIGLTFSLPGDGWCSGGWIGLVITMAIVGGVLGTFHRWFWNHINNPMAAMFYISAMAMILQWYRDGGISISKFIMWNWLPLFIWMGVTWLLGERFLPGNTIILRPGDKLRLIEHKS
ncbi:MAG TPA: hypothetical protein VH413_09980 [Verrucomicrobiae bacterium]|jgi:hypothetical protein|nr:hypothetical protein [Verrucomicrobiae bacterium]